MSAEVSVPDSVSSLLGRFRSCCSARGFEVFVATFHRIRAAPVQGRCVRDAHRRGPGHGLATGLAGVWHHSRAHRFFANTRWDAREFGLILASLVLQLPTEPGAPPILLAVDETLMRRRGPKVFRLLVA